MEPMKQKTDDVKKRNNWWSHTLKRLVRLFESRDEKIHAEGGSGPLPTSQQRNADPHRDNIFELPRKVDSRKKTCQAEKTAFAKDERHNRRTLLQEWRHKKIEKILKYSHMVGEDKGARSLWKWHYIILLKSETYYSSYFLRLYSVPSSCSLFSTYQYIHHNRQICW